MTPPEIARTEIAHIAPWFIAGLMSCYKSGKPSLILVAMPTPWPSTVERVHWCQERTVMTGSTDSADNYHWLHKLKILWGLGLPRTQSQQHLHKRDKPPH